MDKKINKILFCSIASTIIVALIFVALVLKNNEQIIPSLGGQAGNIIDLVGTRIGTTTTGVAFSNNSATTTYPLEIGREYDTIEFNIRTTSFTSTGGANARFSVITSNDYDCDTSTTTTVLNVPVTGDINWFDAGDHVVNLAGSKTLTGTSTILWTPTAAGQGTSLVLKDLNSRCVALEVNASGTSLWIQANKKSFK